MKFVVITAIIFFLLTPARAVFASCAFGTFPNETGNGQSCWLCTDPGEMPPPTSSGPICQTAAVNTPGAGTPTTPSIPSTPSPASSTFYPLATIPGLEASQYSDLPSYLNAVFNLVISVAAMLAVIMIIYHGIQYMTQEAVGEKKDAMLGIRSTIFGLILLLLSWVILHVIDPNITNLDALKSELGGAPAANSAGTSQTFSFENQQSSDWDAACVSKGGAVHLTCATGPYKGESISQCGSTSSGIIHSCVK